MREVETDSVIWPSWCYTGENRLESDTLKSRNSTKSPVNKIKKKHRASNDRFNGASIGSENRCPTPASTNTFASSVTATTTSIKMEVKTERLSPSSGITDNNSSGSGSNTPSSSYPGTPPGSNHHNDRVPSPLSPTLNHPKIPDQPVARNYSDIMRSLAAKYNNSNPNDFYNTPKNGFSGTFGDPRFTSFKSNPSFGNLVPALNSGDTTSPNQTCISNTKDADVDLKQMLNAEAQNSLFSSFGLSSFTSSSVPAVQNLPLFSPLVDMSSTQALLNMVRTASTSSANQLENYIKAAKRPEHANPLDLSSNSQPNVKKPKRPSSGDSETCRTRQKRTGSVSPKPRVKSFACAPSNATTPSDHRCLSLCAVSPDRQCTSRDDNISRWSIDDVHKFVSSIDICAEYADNFREQSIDGISLPLLTEEHLRTTMHMKLGPALKFRAILAQKLGHCNVCMHCLHCHGAADGHSLTPLPNVSPTSRTNNRPNSVGN